MKKKSFVLTGLALTLMLSACGIQRQQTEVPEAPEEINEVEAPVTEAVAETTQEVVEEPASDEPEFLVKAAEAAGTTTEDVRDYEIGDFDGDGKDEAFVIVGGEIDEDWAACDGTLWFVTEDGCEMVHGAYMDVYNDRIIHCYSEDDRTFVVVNDNYTTSSVSNIYYVEDGQVKESGVSGLGAFFNPAYVDGYGISVSAYDSYCEYEEGKEDEALYSGHTWKVYYFYYDKDAGDFREYDGQPITEEELMGLTDENLLEEIRLAGYEVDDMYKRDNGMVNINYHKKTVEDGTVYIEYGNANFNSKTGKYVEGWEEGVNTWENSNFGGEYLKSFTNT